MEKGRAREWRIWKDVDGGVFVNGPETEAPEGVLVREVIPLTDEEKRRLEKIEAARVRFGFVDSHNVKFLLSLLERAGVIE